MFSFFLFQMKNQHQWLPNFAAHTRVNNVVSSIGVDTSLKSICLTFSFERILHVLLDKAIVNKTYLSEKILYRIPVT